MIKRFFNKVFYIFIPILYRKLKVYQKLENNARKEKLIQKLQSVGYGFKLNAEHYVFRAPRKIIIGNNVHIGNNIFIAGEGGLIIKDNTHISRNVSIYTTNHNYNGEALPYDNSTVYKPVVIGKNVWIGMNVSILPGTVIEDGAIVGMGSVVNRRVKKNEIVGNTSLSHIKYRPEEHYDDLERKNQYGGPNGKLLVYKEIDNYMMIYSQNRNKNIVFVLSTGRSGSKSIVEILNQNPLNAAFHEDIQQLIRLSTELAYNPTKKQKIQGELEEIFNTKVWQAEENQILIHSDQRLWNFIPFLKDYFPNSKFIHLKRDAIPSVKSMMARGWYIQHEYPNHYQHDWAKYRLQGDKVKEFSTKDWSNLNQTQKCTWYWYYINERIGKQLLEISKSRVLSLCLKDLNKNLEKLSNFVNSEHFTLKIIKTNQVRNRDISNYNKLENANISIEIEKFLKILKTKNT